MNITPLRAVPMSNTGPRNVKVTLGYQYGQEVIYPACDDSRIFCQIAGTKTMTRQLVDQVKSLGYRVEVIPTQPKEL